MDHVYNLKQHELLTEISKALVALRPGMDKIFDRRLSSMLAEVGIMKLLSSGITTSTLRHMIHASLEAIASELEEQQDERLALQVRSPLIVALINLNLKHLDEFKTQRTTPSAKGPTPKETHRSKALATPPADRTGTPTQSSEPTVRVSVETPQTSKIDSTSGKKNTIVLPEPPITVQGLLRQYRDSKDRTHVYSMCNFIRDKKYPCLSPGCRFCSCLFSTVSITACGTQPWMACSRTKSKCHTSGWYPHIGTTCWKRVASAHSKGAQFTPLRRSFPWSINNWTSGTKDDGKVPPIEAPSILPVSRDNPPLKRKRYADAHQPAIPVAIAQATTIPADKNAKAKELWPSSSAWDEEVSANDELLQINVDPTCGMLE
jgi:hypothetical protein